MTDVLTVITHCISGIIRKLIAETLSANQKNKESSKRAPQDHNSKALHKLHCHVVR